MRRVFALAAAMALLCLAGTAQADVFNLGAGLTNLETVAVGDPGNMGDSRYDYPPGPTSFGSVGYTYDIGKYEVTAAQYCDFLNHKGESDLYGLYNLCMDTAVDQFGCDIKRTGVSGSYCYSVALDWANRPVNYVSFWDACRFANWLHNGQGDGDTETGAYSLSGYCGWDGRSIQRSAQARWAITSEDEWFKAAYYKGGGADAGYWDYPMQSDLRTLPSNHLTSPDGGNNANFCQSLYTIDRPYYRTNVGEFENSESAYGTFDQGGNVWEWNEAIIYVGVDHAVRGMRGGAFENSTLGLEASWRINGYRVSDYEDYSVGFRVCELPEPSSIIALASGLVLLVGLRWRKT